MLNQLLYLSRFKDKNLIDLNALEDKNSLGVKSGNLIAKIADGDEIKQAIDLRTKVFAKEYKKKILVLKSDIDEFDQYAKHLIVKNISTNKVIAGYRVIESQSLDRYYSSSEFDIRNLNIYVGNKLELSKAVVHPNFRNGKTIQILWKGLLKYAAMRNTRYLFGIPSIQTTDMTEAQDILNWFRINGHYSHSIAATNETFKHSGKEKLNYSNVEDVIPNLLKIYLKSGAKIISGPAIDLQFKCTDYLMILDLFNIDAKYKNRFNPNLEMTLASAQNLEI
jgi:putative hemolysin